MTDRTLAASGQLDDLAWNGEGLVAVVAQDRTTGRVLMVAWANRDALARSLETGELHFWSRSREQLWRKGETSGNVLRLGSLHADCDGDTVLALVEPTGPACHTGEETCFGDLPAERTARDGRMLAALWAVIDARARTLPEDSYTSVLLGDENLRLKKLGEETAELVTALARGDREQIPEEAADLVYHLLVALRAAGSTWEEVESVLDARARS